MLKFGLFMTILLAFTSILATTVVADDAPDKAQLAARSMVVIGPSRFHKTLERYLAYRSAQRPTHWASLESILKDSPGVDDPEKLKRWLFKRWKEQHLRYVLLVGDADMVPVRYMVLDRITPAAFDFAFYPSDLYYADVAHRDGRFDDWNARPKTDFTATISARCAARRTRPTRSTSMRSTTGRS